MVKGKQQRRRDRRRQDAAVPPALANLDVLSVEASGASQVTVTFNGFVMISQATLPTSWEYGTGHHTITAIVSSTGLSYVFTVSGTVAAAQVYAMPGNDPAARSTTGGYVNASAGDLV